MSGYLARLAARASGAPAAAGPRLPSRFEPSSDDGPADPAAEAASPNAPARDDAGIRVRGEAPRAVERTPEEPRAELSVADDRSREARGAEGEAATPAPPTNTTIGERGAAERGDRLPPERPLVAAAPVARRVEAVPAPRAAASPNAAGHRDEAPATRPEPDVVHVTIGRVEVRATVAAQTSASRAPRPPRDAEQALHDYLAGRTR